MTWTLLGWILIGLAALLMAILTWGVRVNAPAPRKKPFFQRFTTSQAKAMEQGKPQQVVLGNQLWSSGYPGLGLSALSAMSALITPETLADGRQSISASSGGLAVIARQVVEGCYAGGFSDQLTASRVEAGVVGITPFSFSAGLLSEFKSTPPGNLLYLGDFGPEAVLAVRKAADQGGEVFAGAGTMAAQATLFLYVRDLLLGEEVFMLAPSLSKAPQGQASLLVEDLLRLGIILLLVAGAVLKMSGVL